MSQHLDLQRSTVSKVTAELIDTN